MLFHRMMSRDIQINLATENYLMTHYQINEPILLMYIQAPSLIVGRHQNIYDEIKLNTAEADGVTITRRLSGGGTVYDDFGNISFGFVVDKSNVSFGDYTSIVEPIVMALKEMGVKNVAVNGRNDILIGDKKISGNAMYTKKNRMFSHGTLLYDVDLEKLPRYLNVSKEKLASKHIQSVSSRVTNIKPHLAKEYQELSTEAFRDELIKKIYNVSDLSEISAKEILLTTMDNLEIEKSVNEVYGNREWVFGHHQPYTTKRKAYIPSVGLIEARFQLKEGQIHMIDFLGDFFNQSELVDLRQALEGVYLTKKDLEKALETVVIHQYFTNLTKETFISFLIGESTDD